MSSNDPTKPNVTPQPSDKLYADWVMKIANAANVEISPETVAIYLEMLKHLSANQIQTAAVHTMNTWGKPGLMPPLAFILDRVPKIMETVDEIHARYQREIEEPEEDKPGFLQDFALRWGTIVFVAGRTLEEETKMYGPQGWVTPEIFKDRALRIYLDFFVNRATQQGIPRTEVEQGIETGKKKKAEYGQQVQTQWKWRNYIEQLTRADQSDQPGLPERSSASPPPTGPDAKQKWVSTMGTTQGWQPKFLSVDSPITRKREPGDDDE